MPPAKSGSCFPPRIPPPADSPYSAFSPSTTAIPSTTRPNGAKPCGSRVCELSARLKKSWVVRPLGTANAYAIVPRRLDTRRMSSGIVAERQAAAISGMPWIPNWAHRPATTRKNRASS